MIEKEKYKNHSQVRFKHILCQAGPSYVFIQPRKEKDSATAYRAPALASPLHNLNTRFYGKKKKKTTSGQRWGHGVWLLRKPPTRALYRERRGRREVEKLRVRQGGRSQEDWWKLDARSSMYSYVSLWVSSQDLNALIIHKVVLRYANMNYLTSRADLLLRLTLSSVSVYPLILSSFHSSPI